MPKDQRNPYVIGRPIFERDLFVGREELFQFIEDNLLQGSKVILLNGQRRIGKTSLLAQIPNFIQLEQFVFVSLSLEGKSQKSLAEVLHYLATEILKRFKLLELSVEKVAVPSTTELEINPQTFTIDFLPQVYHVLKTQKLVLLLDEFDVIDNSHQSAVTSYFSLLPSIIVNDQQDTLFIIPVIGRQLGDLATLTTLGLFRQAPKREVGRLNETNTRRLITKPAEGILQYHPDAIQAIWELSSGHPYFTQVLCSVVFEQARDREEDDWQQITGEDVGKIVDRAIEAGEGGLDWFRRGLPIPEQVVFAAIAEMQQRSRSEPWRLLEDSGIILTEELYQAEKNLIESGFLKPREPLELSREQPYSYVVAVELVRRWLLKKHPLQKEILELEKLNPAAMDLYQKAVDLRQHGDTLEAIDLLHQVLKANPNHFSALFEIAEAYLEIDEFSKAVELYTRVSQVAPTLQYMEGFLKSLLGYGRDLMQQGELELAREQLTRALELEPDNKLAQRRLADVRAGLAQTEAQLEKAREKTRQSLQTRRNPFFIGGPVPPEYFVGRSSQISAAFDQIAYRTHLAIHGGTGTGKSSILRFLASPQAWQDYGLIHDEAIIVSLDCESIIPFSPLAFWREILNLLREHLHDEDALQAKIDELLKQEILDKTSIREILRQINKRNQFLLLLLDNYEAALSPNENYTEADMQIFLSEFRDLAVHSAERRNLSIIVTSSQRLNDYGPQVPPNASPWYNHYLFGSLPPFTTGEVTTLLDLMPAEVNLTPELKQVIQEMSGGYPVLLQTACYLIYDNWRNGDVFTIESFAENFLRNTEHIFQNWWSSSSEIEQILLVLIALSHLQGRLNRKLRFDLSDIDVIFSQQSRVMSKLEDRGLIQRTEQQRKTVYLFTSSMMEWWVIRQLQNSSEATLLERKKLLSYLSRRQVEQITNIIQQVWEYGGLILSPSRWLVGENATSHDIISLLGHHYI